jgi:hypothetical protein
MQVYIYFALVLASAQPPESPAYSAFRRGVAPSLEELIPARFALVACQRVPKNQRKRETEIERQYSAAGRKFREQVAAHWPYNDSEVKSQQQSSEEALKQVHSLFSRAKGGEPPHIDRDEAVGRILRLAQGFPNSPVSDEAHFLTAYLYWDVKPRRRDEGYKLMETVHASTGPLNAYQIMAADNLASESDADEQRLADRQRFSAMLRDLRDPRVLKERLLNPLPMESQDRYVKRVLGTLVNVEGSYALNASNMVVDAMRTAHPQESIDQLRKSEAENPYLQQDLRRRGHRAGLPDSAGSGRGRE